MCVVGELVSLRATVRMRLVVGAANWLCARGCCIGRDADDSVSITVNCAFVETRSWRNCERWNVIAIVVECVRLMHTGRRQFIISLWLLTDDDEDDDKDEDEDEYEDEDDDEEMTKTKMKTKMKMKTKTKMEMKMTTNTINDDDAVCERRHVRLRRRRSSKIKNELTLKDVPECSLRSARRSDRWPAPSGGEKWRGRRRTRGRLQRRALRWRLIRLGSRRTVHLTAQCVQVYVLLSR
jgi:hypothetical protein